jgi:hypothetical protein
MRLTRWLFQTAEAWKGRVAGVQPQAWAPADLRGWAGVLPEGKFETVWLSDGLAHPGRGPAAALQDRGTCVWSRTPRPVYGLHPRRLRGWQGCRRGQPLACRRGGVGRGAAHGPRPGGIDRVLGRGHADLSRWARPGPRPLDLPPELRNRITRFELLGATAGAVSLTDDSLKRRKIALIRMPARPGGAATFVAAALSAAGVAAGGRDHRGQPDRRAGAKPDVVILADVADLTKAEQDADAGLAGEGRALAALCRAAACRQRRSAAPRKTR